MASSLLDDAVATEAEGVADVPVPGTVVAHARLPSSGSRYIVDGNIRICIAQVVVVSLVRIRLCRVPLIRWIFLRKCSPWKLTTVELETQNSRSGGNGRSDSFQSPVVSGQTEN